MAQGGPSGGQAGVGPGAGKSGQGGPNIGPPKLVAKPVVKKPSIPVQVSTADQRAKAAAGSRKRKGTLAAPARPAASTIRTSGQGLMTTVPTAKKNLLGY
jgi:hypothetical protein